MVEAPFAGMYFTPEGNILFFNGPNGAAGTAASNGTNSLVLHNSGQVGVGTSATVTGYSDLSFKFFVEGGIRARKLKVDINNWADYVFEPTYKLPSLQEVELFIKQYRHLPGIPSAREVEKEGLDIGGSQVLLLQKIEELTLYMIEQQKEIRKMRETIHELETKIHKLK